MMKRCRNCGMPEASHPVSPELQCPEFRPRSAWDELGIYLAEHFGSLTVQVVLAHAHDAVMAEREACARLAVSKSALHAGCDYLGCQDMETGEIPCSRRDGCLCDDLAEHGEAIAKAIRARGEP